MSWFVLEKKGELSTTQIIALLILLGSFIVIIFFLFRLNLGNETDAEICHNSVVTRGSAVIPADTTPLKCSENIVCITKDGSCEGLLNPEVKKAKSETEVYSLLADEMANCWWMFGEGKVDYIGDKIMEKNYCSFCARILFDDSLKEISGFENGKISKDKLYTYLSNAKYSEDKSYSEYLFGTSDIEGLKSQVIQDATVSDAGTFGEIEIGTQKQYLVVMGITSEIGNVYKFIGGGVAVVGIFVPGIGWTASGLIIGALVFGAGGEVAGLIEPEIGAIVVEGNGIDNHFMTPTIIEYNSEKFAALDCKNVVSLS